MTMLWNRMFIKRLPLGSNIQLCHKKIEWKNIKAFVAGTAITQIEKNNRKIITLFNIKTQHNSIVIGRYPIYNCNYN